MMRDFESEARTRWDRCVRIADHAQRQGLLATPEKVNRNFTVWTRWDEGRLATGYLMRMTGVKLRERI
jgi:hypothetical protein